MGNGALSFDEWCNHQRRKVPQFQYWHTALQLELLLLVFLKSLRLADFGMYVDAVYKMLPYQLCPLAPYTCTRYARTRQ